MPIVDARSPISDTAILNRRRLLDRIKSTIKDQVFDIGKNINITDIAKSKKEVKIKNKTLKEPKISYDGDHGSYDHVGAGNDKYHKGDKEIRQSGSGKERGYDGDDSEDEFTFNLQLDEFIDIYFEDCELPFYVKQLLTAVKQTLLTRAGFTKKSTQPRLDLKKTFEVALARKIASKPKKVIFLDESDLRYRHYQLRPKIIKQAAVFFVLDVSGSMTEPLKERAKKFFLILYLFLYRHYEHVSIEFISHTTIAKIVDEKEFFYSKRTGGTLIEPALSLVDQTIKDKYNVGSWNIYLAQATDGDAPPEDADECISLLKTSLLKKLQYYAFIELKDTNAFDWTYYYTKALDKARNLNDWFNVGITSADSMRAVYIAFHRLFSRSPKKGNL